MGPHHKFRRATDAPHELDPARALIDSCGIDVPAAFTDEELKHFSCHAGADRRVELAVSVAPQGRIAQYLASDQHTHPVLRARSLDRALQSQDTSTLHIGAVVLQKRGRTEEAAAWYRLAAEFGDPLSVRLATELLLSIGQKEQASRWLQQQVSEGDADAALELARQARHSKDGLTAATWYQRAADLGGPDEAVHHAATLLHRNGRTTEALEWLETRADQGDLNARCAAAELLWKTRHTGKALNAFRRAAEDGHPGALRLAADWLRRDGRLDEALDQYRLAAEAGDLHSLPHIAQLLDRWPLNEAVAWCLETASSATIPEQLRFLVMRRATRLLLSSGSDSEALVIAERAASLGDPKSMRAAAVIHHRMRKNNTAALMWYQLAASKGDIPSMEGAERLPPGTRLPARRLPPPPRSGPDRKPDER